MVSLGQNAVEIVINARDNFSKVLNKAKLSLAGFQKSALALSAVGVGIAAGFAKAIQTSISFESAFAGVKKTVDLTEEGFAELEQRFKDISKTTPIAFVELSRIGELAGQLGVEGVDDLEKFTRTIADISVTTNLTAEAAATDFARIANVMQEPLENVDRMGSVVVDLGNNFATTEAEISTFAQRISGAGKIVGFTTAEVFSIGTALSSVGVQAEAGGTAVQTALLKINESVTEGDEKLLVFAETAGLTAEDFATMWETDAAGAFEKFIVGLGTQGDQAQLTLDAVELGGVRTARSFLSLAGAGDLLTNALETGDKAWEENIALSEEAEKRYGTLASQIDIAKNQLAILGDEIGDRITPFIVNYLIPAIKRVSEWWDKLSPKTQNAILIFTAVTAAVTLLAGAIALVTFVASPWLLIIGAIAVAIGAIIVAIIYWKEVLLQLVKWSLWAAGILDKIWEALKDFFTIIWEEMKNVVFRVFNSIVDYIGRKIQKAIDFINKLIWAANLLPKVNIDFIPNVDLNSVKGQITDIGALKSTLQLERESRASQFSTAANQIYIQVEGNIMTEKELTDTIEENISNDLGDMIS